MTSVRKRRTSSQVPSLSTLRTVPSSMSSSAPSTSRDSANGTGGSTLPSQELPKPPQTAGPATPNSELDEFASPLSMSASSESDEDENDDYIPSPPTQRRYSSTSHANAGSSKAKESDSAWFDLPLALALLPPLGSFLFHGDYLKDFILLALLMYYLHSLIKTPWELYTMARARRSPSQISEPDAAKTAQLRALARSELRLAELSYLAFCLATPVVGAFLLKFVAALLSAQQTISWFSIGVFGLATGIRPWRHLISILRHRTEALHDIVHVSKNPSSQVQVLRQRVSELEKEIERLTLDIAKKHDLIELNDVMEEGFEQVSKEFKNYQRKVEFMRLATEARFSALEVKLGDMAKMQDLGITTSGTSSSNFRSLGKFPEAPSLGPLTWLFGNGAPNGSTDKSPTIRRKSSTMPLSPTTSLSTVPEEDEKEVSGNGHTAVPMVRRRSRSSSMGISGGKKHRKSSASGWINWALYPALFPLRVMRGILIGLLRGIWFAPSPTP